ncbi:MAG: tRNA dihydrouridine synthase DusB [Ruminococcus sp.]|nr:tRNA dihydrouridine synthase DusB [Ruminococcus sp.]
MSFKIGNVEIKNELVLAPMAGISNTSYRKICKKMGVGLIFAEMVSSNALIYGNDKTLDLLKMSEEERPIAQQIFGSDVKTFVEAAKIVEETMRPDIIDINMGCPVPKVAIRAQAGSALLKNPKKIGEIVKAVVDSVSCPVTIKIRSGWDNEHINAVEVAKIAEENGASAIIIHARTRAQGYSGKADWNVIKEVKENVNIPIIGNGDVTDANKCLEMLETTGCDAVMIGRGALGNPWIFKECLAYLNNKEIIAKPSDLDKLEMILEHYKMLKEDKNEHIALLEIRTHALAYLKGMVEAKTYKTKICQAKNEEEFLSVIEEYKNLIKVIEKS